MKSHLMHSKPKAGGRVVTAQRAAFELKHRIALSLNKIADRDTQQIGVEELEKTAESLTSEGIAPFLSCVAETESEQKSAVRRECVRAMGTLARSHGALLSPHLGKMVTSLVKRLKDPDSVVRDACVELAGVLVTNVRGSGGGGEDGGSGFVALAKPIFEVMGEQNRFVQAGSALCLARAIDEAVNPPASILLQILTRVVKLLKNPHCTAKPAIIELIRSIIQAGGASTEHTLSAAVTAILEALKSNDWTTRKAASVALADIAVSAKPSLGPLKTSCIRSLECCRFDKVKPVRDSIMHAIQCWKTLQGTHSPEPSEAGSSTKENCGGCYPDVISDSDGGWRDTSVRKAGPVSALSGDSTSSTTKRTPLTVRKTCPDYVQNRQHVKPNDWPSGIAPPKTHTTPLVDSHHEESGGSCVAKPFQRAAYTTRGGILNCDYDPPDDKAESSSMSDLVSGSFESKHVTVAHGCLDEGDSADRMNHRSVNEDIDSEGVRSHDRKSLDSTITDSCSRGMHGCCLHAANEFGFIRKQFLEIETRQSNLMNLLQVFMGNSMDSMSTLQLKVHTLEHAVDKITGGTARNDNCASMPGSNLLKKNQSVSSSPRLSTCTHRPFVDSNYGLPSVLSMKNKEMWGGDGEIWRDPTLHIIRNPIANMGVQKDSRRNVQSSVSNPTRGSNDLMSDSSCNAGTRRSTLKIKSGFWKRIKDSLCAGDIESAYTEVLSSCDDLGLIELMDRTGPVLERLSGETASEILSILAAHFLNHKFLGSIIPWLQQVVDLSSAYEPRHFVLPAKARMEFLLAIEEMSAMEFADPAARTSIAQLAEKMSQVWGQAPCRKNPNGRIPRKQFQLHKDHRESQNAVSNAR